SMQIKPLGDRVVIKRFEAEEKTAGGIVLPDTARDKPQRGKVLAVGPGKVTQGGKGEARDVKEGGVGLFPNWAGHEFKQRRGDDVLLMRADDILAVLEQ